MSLTFPRTDIITPERFVQISFDLMSRQELSRTAGGLTRGKDLGPALWRVQYTVRPQRAFEAVDLEAMLHSLDGIINGFAAFDFRRKYPRHHFDGLFNDTGTIKALGSDNKSLSLQDLDPGFQLSRGDYLAIGNGESPDYSGALYQSMETVTADGMGDTVEFEVRPHIRTGPTAGNAVTLKNPKAYFTLDDPNSLSVRTQGSLSTLTIAATQTF